jgi:hypothetical protein
MRVIYTPESAWDETSVVAWAVHLVVPVLGAVVTSGRLGWCLACDVLAEETKARLWLESAAPLKGRWLRLLLRAPWIALVMFCTSLVVAIGLSLLATELEVGMVPPGIAAVWAFWCLFKPLRAGRLGRRLLE